jgi:type VI secretion system protein ImpF
MRYTPSLLDKLVHQSIPERSGILLPGLSLNEVKSSVAADLEALLNTRASFGEEDQQDFPLSARSIVNFGVADFSAYSLSSGLDREYICRSIQLAIERQEPRLRSVVVLLQQAGAENNQKNFNRLSFTIQATLMVSDVIEPVSFDARFESAAQHYTVHSSSR